MQFILVTYKYESLSQCINMIQKKMRLPPSKKLICSFSYFNKLGKIFTVHKKKKKTNLNKN